MNEAWKKIEGYGGKYEVSTCGNVRSFKMKHCYSGHVVTQCISSTGYKQVTLCENGKARRFQVHRLVAAAFIGDVTDMVVHHKNNDKTDNRIENLEIITSRENTIQSLRDRGKLRIET